MSYTSKQKDQIIKQLNNITDEDAKNDFLKLRNIDINNLLTRTGYDIVNKYTLKERMDTVGKGYSFFDVYHNRKELLKRPSIQNYFKYMNSNNFDDIKIWAHIAGLYFSTPSIFRPVIAMNIYDKFKPKVVMDMTMGWGGRLVGACALDIKKYIGIDNNIRLKKPYEKLVKLLDPLCKTEIELYFCDALKFDYNKHYYDLVLTSPPYYNIEKYHGQKNRSKEEWDKDFYIPIITKSYNGLQKGGYYCLNISIEIFERVVENLLGTPTYKIPFSKMKRSITKYKEFIYVWKK
jgi:hypothetical protein